MLKVFLQAESENVKMVKATKRNVKSPRRKNSLSIARPLISRTRTVATTSSALTSPSGASIKVVVRVRPPNSRETEGNQKVVIRVVDDQLIIFDPKEESQAFFYHGVQQRGRDLLKKSNKNLQFIFDRVFGFESTNYDVFENSTQSLISSLMDGYNCSVFVYGATGAGKTHTMLGGPDNPGITFLTMHELFRKKDQLLNERDFDLAVIYLEVYNETVQDLLCPGKLLQLREDGKYGVMVSGTEMKRISSPDELFEMLNKGNKNRTQHPTDANAESSRSHAVFQVFLRMTIKTTGEVRVAKLSMIDLAGSERGAATGCAGARFTEGANINKSLLALGNCINSLADGHRHVPYRNSKLTRLLKDSLGGNCQTVMIANISPSSSSYEDTYNTLKYATRAKKIKSHVKKNVVNCEMHVGQYVKLVEELNKEVERLKREVEETKAEKSASQVDVRQLELQAQNECDDRKLEAETELRQLFEERKTLLERVYALKGTDLEIEKRIELKEDADSRLSSLLSTPQKDQGRKRLGKAVDRLQRQTHEVKTEITSLEQQIMKLKQRICELMEKGPSSLRSFVELEDAKFAQLESNLTVQLFEKIITLQQLELESRGTLISHMSDILKPCYFTAKEKGFVTKEVTKEYQEMVQKLLGMRTVTWKDDKLDSGLSGTSSSALSMLASTATNDEESRATKRKAEDLSSCVSLDTTIVKDRSCVGADHLMAKVCVPSPAKRLAGTRSPRILNKENIASKRLIGTMGTAQRFPSASSGDKNRTRRPTKLVSSRSITPRSGTLSNKKTTTENQKQFNKINIAGGGDVQKISLKLRQ